MLRALAPWLWLLPAGAVLVPFFVIPLGVIARYSFNRDDPLAFMVEDWTLANYGRILLDPFYAAIFGNTIWLSASIAVVTLLAAYPFAYFIVRYAKGSRDFLLWAVYLPLIVSVIVRVFGWIIITADSGLINTVLLTLGLTNQPLRLLFEVEGMSLAMVHRYLPLMVLPLVNALAKIDQVYVNAAADLGASRRHRFLTITLPLSIPGIVAGFQLVFANVLSDFVLPNLMGTTRFRLLAPAIYEEASTHLAYATASAMAMVMMILVVVILILTTLFYRIVAPWARGL